MDTTEINTMKKISLILAICSLFGCSKTYHEPIGFDLMKAHPDSIIFTPAEYELEIKNLNE